MNPVLANICNEVEKLVAKRITKFLLLVAGILPFILKLVINKLFITDWMALPSENINYTILDLQVKVLLPLFCFLAAAELFTGEGERGTLLPVRPISRIELFISKMAAIVIIIGSQLILGWLGVTISSMVFDSTFQYDSIFSSLAAFLISWVPLLALTAFSVLFALVVNTSVVAVTSLILLYLVMTFIPYVFPGVLYMLPSSYLDWYMQWLGDVSFRWACQTVLYICSSSSLFLATGYYIFNRKEA
ncbi:membrane spanning protein [Bacillus sp. 1NLA3E]|nr:membrane spanning protein [Bacillus sp. 1NLA3E]